MPLRHGAHHGFSFILGIVISVIAGELFRNIFPNLIIKLDSVSMFLTCTFHLPYPVDVVTKLIIAFFVVVGYGVLFGIKERRRAISQ